MTSKKIYSMLSLSVLVNAFLLGMIFSRVLSPFPPPFIGMHEPRMVGVGLESPYKEQVSNIVTQRQEAMREDMAQMRDLFDQINTVLTAPQFDIEKLREIDGKISAQDKEMKENMAGMMEDIATKLPDEQRIKFFKEFSSNHPPIFMPPMRRELHR